MKTLQEIQKEIKIDNYYYHLRIDYFNDKINIGYVNQHGPAHGLTIQIKTGESIDDAVAILQDKLKNLC
jgi:hypothetical protein